MAKIEEYLDRWAEADEHMKAVRDAFSGGPMNYCIKEVVNCHKSLFDRFCPYKVGDKVQLTKTPCTDNGWRGSSHFLKKGAKGKVKERGYSGEQFTFLIVFDQDSWIDTDGNVHMRSKKERGGYMFNESHLKRYIKE